MAEWIKEKDKIKHEFTPDPIDVQLQKGDVFFLIGLKGIVEGCNVNPNDVRSRLEKNTSKISFVNYFWTASAMLCRTDKETYEELFKAELEYNLTKKGEHGYTPEGYRETKLAQVPDGLADIVKSINLNLIRKI